MKMESKHIVQIVAIGAIVLLGFFSLAFMYNGYTWRLLTENGYTQQTIPGHDGVVWVLKDNYSK